MFVFVNYLIDMISLIVYIMRYLMISSNRFWDMALHTEAFCTLTTVTQYIHLGGKGLYPEINKMAIKR